ncbi:MAG: hypothetical protein LUC17_00025 [Oscillospiraceae bacterium]|nr:hypothetical protein [Oscillospiraceae bacterium]
MLGAVLAYLHNYFVIATVSGTFTISDGKLADPVPDLQNNQYFRVLGSVFNDGIYQNTEDLELTDEAFSGYIQLMAIPRDLLILVDEITAWQEKYGDTVANPFTSESFSGYSYTKAANASTESAMTWLSVFGARLAPYRKAGNLTGDYLGYQDPPFQRPFNPGWPV